MRTHNKGGSLDVLGLECGVVNVQDTVISDHYLITGTLGLKGKPSNPPDVGKANHTATRYYEFRDYSNLDSPAFSDFVSEECSKRLSPCQTVDDYADSMFSIFQGSMDKFAPPSIRKSSENKKKQYKYDAKVAEAKRIRRKLEDQFRRSGLEIHRQMLNAQKTE